MKDRILDYLNDFATGEANELSAEMKSELGLDETTFRERSQEVQREILHHYSQFSISTIDAFFQKVIRSFTRESGLMGDYRLEVETDLVLEEVVNRLIDELGTNKELTAWVVEFANENLQTDKAWDVRLRLIEFAREIFKEDFKAIEEEVLNETNDNNFFRNLRNKLWQVKNHFLNKVSKPAQEAFQIIKTKGWEPGDFKWGVRSGLISFFENFATHKFVKDFLNPSDRIRVVFDSPSDWPFNKNTKRAEEIIEVASAQLVPLKREIVSAYDQLYAQALSAELVLQNLYVFALMADIARKLKDYKEENNVMLLADAPKFLNGVIQESDTPFIYEKVGSFYKNFLIDEFQDTSGFQWKNFFPLLTNSLDQGNPSIVVGDVKQAIYRWRGGNLSLLQQEIEKQIGPHRTEITGLDTNYRSAPVIVDFNNALFKSASGKVSTKTNSELPRGAFREIHQKAFKTEPKGFVQIQFIKETKEDNWTDVALAQVPRQLEHLQQQGVKLNEIAILVRRGDEGHQIAAHLLAYKNSENAKKDCRYDVISEESLRLDGAASVNLLLGAMQYLNNPANAVACAQLAYEFARLKEPDRPLTEVFKVTKQIIFENNLPDKFTQTKAWLKKLPLFELTETLIEIFGIGDLEGELSYLQAFQDVVLEFYRRERNDLNAFLEWWDENKTKKSIKVPGEVEAVQIMTIHKAKGLQFKYVLIPFCSWSMDHESWKAPTLWVKSGASMFKDAGHLPVVYTSRMSESYFVDAYTEENTRAWLDNLNLLYVAFTRAEIGLMVTAPLVGDKSKSVALVLFEGLNENEVLKQGWDESLTLWKSGELNKPKEKKKLAQQVIGLQRYPAVRWRDKLVIRKSSASYFEGEDQQQLEKIRYGLHMHAVLSRVKYADDIPVVLARIVNEGIIAEQEKEALADQLNQLMSQENIADWFDKKWEVSTEMPVLLPGGNENRIDRLMIHDKHVIVVDFKTGEHSSRDQQQVLDYMNLLRQMGFLEVEGFLLYLRNNEVMNVKERKLKSLNRKQDKDQLSLGL